MYYFYLCLEKSNPFGRYYRDNRFGKELNVTAVKILFPLLSGRWSNATEELLNDKEKREVYALLDPGFVYLESPLYSFNKGKKICEALNKKILYISASGDVQLCYTIPFSFGNVRREALKDIMRRLWQSDFFTSIDNNYECVMNNPHFREKYLPIIKDSGRLSESHAAYDKKVSCDFI